MKIFCIGLFLLLVFENLQGSTIPLKRSRRTLNTSFITDFNGTYQRKDPCTNTEVESSSYKASHEFHHQAKEADWNDYTRKCSEIIKGFLEAITDLLASKCQQNGTFNFNINTTVSQNSNDCLIDGKNGTICYSPKITIQTNCDTPPGDCQNLRMVNCIGHLRGGENQEDVKKIEISGKKYKCFPVCDEETEVTTPKAIEDEICTVQPFSTVADEICSSTTEQMQENLSQALAETVQVESNPSNLIPEFHQPSSTKTTEITEVHETTTPLIVPPTNFEPFEPQTEHINESDFIKETFPTTSISDKHVTELPFASFELSATPIPIVQIRPEPSPEVNNEAITVANQLSSEIPVTLPPQPTTPSVVYDEEVVETTYKPTPEPALEPSLVQSPQLIPYIPETQTQFPNSYLGETLGAPVVHQSPELVPVVVPQSPQFAPEIVLPYADQNAPTKEIKSVTEEVYEIKTSTTPSPLPQTPEVVEAPVLPVSETQPQFVPTVDQSLINSAPEILQIQQPVIQPTYYPEVQPEVVAPSVEESTFDSTTTQQPGTDEICEEESSTQTPSAPIADVGQPVVNDYDYLQTEAFQEYPSTPIPLFQEKESSTKQKETIETVHTVSPQAKPLAELPLFTTPAPLQQTTYTEEVVAGETSADTKSLSEPSPLEYPEVFVPETFKDPLLEEVYPVEPEVQQPIKPTTPVITQTVSEEQIVNHFQTSPAPSHELNGWLSNQNFRGPQADSLVTDYSTSHFTTSAPTTEPGILVEAPAASKTEEPCDDEGTLNNFPTTLSPAAQATEFHTETSTLPPPQPQLPLVNDQYFIPLQPETQPTESYQKPISEPELFVPVTDQPHSVTEIIETFEHSTAGNDYSTPAPPAVQPLEHVTPHPQPSTVTFFEEEIIETKTPGPKTVPVPLMPIEIISPSPSPIEKEQNLPTAAFQPENIPLDYVVADDVVQTPLLPPSVPPTVPADTLPVVSEPVIAAQYPTQPPIFNEQVLSTDYNNYSTFEPESQVTQAGDILTEENCDDILETQPPLDLTPQMFTTQPPLTSEVEQQEYMSKHVTEAPEYFTQPPVVQIAVNVGAQKLGTESQTKVTEVFEKEAVTTSAPPQVTTVQTPMVVEESVPVEPQIEPSMSDVLSEISKLNDSPEPESIPVEPEIEPSLSDLLREFSKLNNYSESEITTISPEQFLKVLKDLHPDLKLEKPKEADVVSEATEQPLTENLAPSTEVKDVSVAVNVETAPHPSTIAPEIPSESLVTFAPELPLETPQVPLVPDQYQSYDEQLGVSSSYPEQQFLPMTTPQSGEPCEDEESFPKSHTTINYSDNLSEQNFKQPEFDLTTPAPITEHQPFVDYVDKFFTTQAPSVAYEDLPFAIKYQTSIGPQTQTTTSYFEENYTTKYPTTLAPERLPVIFSEQKPSPVEPTSQNLAHQNLAEEILNPVEPQIESSDLESVSSYNKESDYPYQITPPPTSPLSDYDYTPDPFVPTIAPEPVLEDVKEGQIPVESILPSIPEKEIFEAYGQDSTTASSYTSQTQSAAESNVKVNVNVKVNNSPHDPLHTTPLPTLPQTTAQPIVPDYPEHINPEPIDYGFEYPVSTLPPEPKEVSLEKESISQHSTVVSEHTQEFVTPPVTEAPFDPYTESFYDTEFAQSSGASEVVEKHPQQFFTTLPPPTEYPTTAIESSALLSEQVSRDNFEGPSSITFAPPTTPEKQPFKPLEPFETVSEEPCVDCETQSPSPIEVVPPPASEEPCLDYETTLAPEIHSEHPVDYTEHIPGADTSVPETPKPQGQIFEQYSDVTNNYSNFESTTLPPQEFNSFPVTPVPPKEPFPVYDEPLATIPPASQTSFSNFDNQDYSYDTFTKQTQLPLDFSKTVTPFPNSQVTPDDCAECETPIPSNIPAQEFPAPLPETEVIPEEPCVDCESPNPVKAEIQTDYVADDFTATPPPFFYPQTTPAPSFTEFVNKESEFSETTTKYDKSNDMSTPTPDISVAISINPVTPEHPVLEDPCDDCESQAPAELPLDYEGQLSNFNTQGLASESLVTEATTKTESTTFSPKIQPLGTYEEESQALLPEVPIAYDELPQTAEQNIKDSTYTYSTSTTAFPEQQPPVYDDQSLSELKPIEEQDPPGYFNQFNVKNTLSDSLVTEKVTNEQPPMIYDTTLSPEIAPETFQTVLQLNSTFTPQPQPTILVTEPVHQPFFVQQPHLPTEHLLSSTSESVATTTTVPPPSEEPCDDEQIDSVTSTPAASDPIYTHDFGFLDSKTSVTAEPTLKPEILEAETTPNVALHSQSNVNDEILTNNQYLSPVPTQPPTALFTSPQPNQNFHTKKVTEIVEEYITTKHPPLVTPQPSSLGVEGSVPISQHPFATTPSHTQFSKSDEVVVTEKPLDTAPLPVLYPTTSEQIHTEQSLLPQSQTIALASAQPEKLLFYESETVTTTKTPSSPAPSQHLNAVPSQPQSAAAVAVASAGPITQALPPNIVYFDQEVITTKSTPSSPLPQTQTTTPIPLISSSTAPTHKIVEEIITTKYPSSVTPQPPIVPVSEIKNEPQQPVLVQTLPLEIPPDQNPEILPMVPSENLYLGEEVVAPQAHPVLPPSQIGPIIPLADPNGLPLASSGAFIPQPFYSASLPNKFKEVKEEVIITNSPTVSQQQLTTPYVETVPHVVTTPAPAPLPKKFTEVNEEVVVINKPTTPHSDSTLPPFLQPLPPSSAPNKVIEVEEAFLTTNKQSVHQTTTPSFVQTTLAPPKEFKKVEEEIIITNTPTVSQHQYTTPSFIETPPPVARPLPAASIPKKYTEVSEEVIITNKPTNPQLLTTPSSSYTTFIPPTTKVVEVNEELTTTNKHLPAPTPPPTLSYSENLAQTQPSDLVLISPPLNPQSPTEKVTYFDQEIITTTGPSNAVPPHKELPTANAYLPIHSVGQQPVYPGQSDLPQHPQTIDYFEQQPQTLDPQGPVVASFASASNIPQEVYPDAGVSVAQVDTISRPPIPYAVAPEQTAPSSEPGEDSSSCSSRSRPTLLCPFNPALKGNMTAPSYYILVSKIPDQSGTGEQCFQIEKVFLGDGTPLDCTLREKTFPTSQYKPIPIASSRTVTLPTSHNS